MSLGYLRSWLHRPASSRRQRLAARKNNMGVEQLEQRQLLSTTPTTLLLDFGAATSPVAAGYTQVTPVKYSAARGFGWQSTSGLTAHNRNTGDPLTQDFHRGKNNTFLADVPNGTYQVTAVLGNLSGPLDRVNIVAEGSTAASGLSATANSTVESTFQVNVTDGRLNLQFIDRGGRSPYFSLAALNISAVDATPTTPTANAGTDQFAHEGDTVSFSGRATGGAGLSYLWDFGDGTTQTGTLTPNHVYQDNGTYTVSLTVTDALGQSATDTALVTLDNVAPRITLDGPSHAAVGTPVQFFTEVTDPGQADVDAGLQYFWLFGDGNSSSEANPEHTFAYPGTYTVIVMVMDKDGTYDTAMTSVQVGETTPGPNVNAGPDQNGAEGTAVSFNGTTSDGASGLSYLWDFGDGSSASDTLTPSHVYQDNGSYTVTLTVTDAAGESRSDTALVTIANVAPTPLPGGPYTGSPGAPIAFGGNATDASEADTQAGFSYRWDFGDGTTSSQRNPSKTYAAAGTFTVRLTVTDKDGGATTAETTATIGTTPVPLGANAGTDRSGNEGALVAFSGTASGGTGPLSYLWDFGDGSTAVSTLTPAHTYRDNGNYTVTLTVTDAAGASRTDTARVTVGNLAPSASVGGPYSGSAGQAVAFAGTATDPGADDEVAGLNYSWDFGDGGTGTGTDLTHVYAAAGTYTVRLTVTDKDGAATTVQTSAVIQAGNPSPGLTANAGADQSGTEGQSVSFLGTGASSDPRATGLSYLWSFGDGTTATGTLTPNHVYQDNGIYTVTLTVTDGLGNSAQDTALVTVANAAPSASAGGPYSAVRGTSLAFAGSAADPGAVDQAAGFSFRWDFGDGTTSTSANPTHVYGAPGDYTITLTVTDKDGGTASVTTTASITDPVQPGPTGDFIVTAFDRIPNFGADPTITSARSGNWSDPGTWSLGRVPVAGDIVSITGGKTVAYDVVSDAAIKTVAIQSGAQLNFRTDINTRLTVTNFLVMEGGTLQIGTQANPVAASVKAEVVFTNTPLDTVNDPEQYGNGLIALGKVTMHGAAKSQTFVRLAVEPKAGDTTLTLSEPVSGWRVGDQLTLPDTRQLQYAETPTYGTYAWEGETLTVAAISADGRTVTLAAPLARDHRGARSVEGALEFLPHVMNRSRNVVVRSQSASGVRGHTLFTERADVDIRYAGFVGLGRTTNNALDNTTFDGAGNVTHVGANQTDRYSVYFRHLTGPQGTPANGHRFTFVGNSVFCPMQDHSFKWGVVLTGSDQGLIRDNVLYNWAGAGIVLDEGTEDFNVIEHNFVVRIRGPYGWNKPTNLTGNDIGAAIWMVGTNNYVRDNVVANVADGGGYMYFPKGGPAVGETIPILEFARNEVYGATQDGLHLWNLGAINDQEVVPIGTSTIKDFRVWHHFQTALYYYNVNNSVVDGMIVRGDKTVTGYNSQNTGFSGGEYLVADLTMRNSDIQGTAVGFSPSNITQGTTLIENSYFNSLFANIAVGNLATGAPNVERMGDRRTIISNVRFGTLGADQGFPQKNIAMSYTDFNANVTAKDEILVYSYNGVAGDDFQVFYHEQRPDFVVIQSIYNADGSLLVKASPEAGLTNQQLWNKYRLAVAGAVATNTTTRAGIEGLVRDL